MAIVLFGLASLLRRFVAAVLTSDVVTSVPDPDIARLKPGLSSLSEDEIGSTGDLALLVDLLVLVGQHGVLEAVEGTSIVTSRALGAQRKGLRPFAVCAHGCQSQQGSTGVGDDLQELITFTLYILKLSDQTRRVDDASLLPALAALLLYVIMARLLEYEVVSVV